MDEIDPKLAKTPYIGCDLGVFKHKLTLDNFLSNFLNHFVFSQHLPSAIAKKRPEKRLL